jgi:hypothetical protein
MSVWGSSWSVAIPPPIAARLDHVRATGKRVRGLGWVAQIADGDLAPFSDPVWRRATVRYPYLPVWVPQEAPDDRRADRPGAPGYKYAGQF